ncbi:MAG: molecular chaperone DnaK [Coprococcus sp.]|nr:molecular chaperone DnaK [Coprococcus sp.]
MSRVIGIDLGTTNSCVAVLEGEQATIITNSEGNRTTPSVVAITKSGDRLVGDAAKRQLTVNVDRTISSIKREMGTSYRKKIDGKDYSPQEISAIILSKLKSDAEEYLGESVTDAVITVPAYFDDSQRQATKDAGRIAGLNVLRIINEPTSAALAYGLDNGQPQKILVYDLGGGTFDVSVIEIGDHVIEVLATAGDNHLGGDDFDNRLVEYVIKTFKKEEKVNLEKDITAVQRVKEACENAKKELSFSMNANINLPFITTVKNTPKHLDMHVSRQKFDELTFDLVARTAEPVNQALRDAGISAKELDKVLLVGGSTRIPAVVDKVKQLTGKEVSKKLNPDECVAMGAAIQGGKLGGELMVTNKVNDILLMDVTPLSLSIETLGGVANVIIPRNSAIPTRASKIFTTAGNFQRDVEIKVYQGERKFTRDNKLLGNFRLSGIKRAMAGVPQIEVTFDMDANGILKVSAKDLGRGVEQQIVITSSTNLTEEEIQRAREDAMKYENDTANSKEIQDIRNDAEAYIYKVENLLAEKGSRLDKKEVKRIRQDAEFLKKLVCRTDVNNITTIEAGKIKEAYKELQESAGKLELI